MKKFQSMIVYTSVVCKQWIDYFIWAGGLSSNLSFSNIIHFIASCLGAQDCLTGLLSEKLRDGYNTKIGVRFLLLTTRQAANHELTSNITVSRSSGDWLDEHEKCNFLNHELQFVLLIDDQCIRLDGLSRVTEPLFTCIMITCIWILHLECFYGEACLMIYGQLR